MKKPAQGGLGEFDDDVLGDAYKTVCATSNALYCLPVRGPIYEVFPGRQGKAAFTAPLVTMRP